MSVERCPVVGPSGWCQHDDGDGYWPAAVAQTRCMEEEAVVIGERSAAFLRLPEGWEWAAETAFVHVGPMAGLDGSREVVVSREVRAVA